MSVRLAGASLRSCIAQNCRSRSEPNKSSKSGSSEPTTILQERPFNVGSWIPKNNYKVLNCKELIFTGIPLSAKISALCFTTHAQCRMFTRPALDPSELQISSSSSSATLLEMKKFLRHKAIDFKESHACLIITLPKSYLTVDSSTLKGRNKNEDDLTKIYVNKQTSRFLCPEEKIFGDWSNLRAFLQALQKLKSSRKELREQLPQLGHKIDFDKIFDGECLQQWNESCPVESLSEKDFKELIRSFKLPSKAITEDNFARLGVRLCRDEEGRPSLLFPIRYPFFDTILGVKKVSIDQETGEILEENLPSEKSLLEHQVIEGRAWIHRTFPLPHGIDIASKSNNSSVILVASVLDSLVLSDHINVVALSEGASNLPPEHLPFFEQFSKIIFWFPETVPSSEAVTTFSRKLDERKCFTVSREFAQPLIWLSKRRSKVDPNPTQILKNHLRPCCHEHITTFQSLRENVYLEMAHFEEVEGIKWKRFDQLNELIRGFRRGELTIFSGRTGSGKTTFMSEYSLDLCMQGVNTLWGSFEVSNTRLAKMQLKQFSGVNIEENLNAFDNWADKFEKLPMFYLTFHGAQEVDKVLEAMSTAVYQYDICHIIIDNIQFMMGTSNRNMDRFHAQDIVIQKLRRFATIHNIHLTLVIHPRKEDPNERLSTSSIFGGAKATQEADNVILMQEEDISLKIKRKYIQVMKNRYTGDLGTMSLQFNRGTLTFSKKIFQRDRNVAIQQRKLKRDLDTRNPDAQDNEEIGKDST